MNKAYFLGCDWGTSTFRLRLFNLVENIVVGEIVTSEGVANTFNSWQADQGKTIISTEQYFRQKLKLCIDALAEKLLLNLDNIPVMISGMASSSIGMLLVDYADLPFSLDGSNAKFVRIPADKDFSNEIVLISGVKSCDDVMRGEETQVLGLMSLLQEERFHYEKAMLILPGTHSKHIQIEGDAITNFQTFMTGEVYELLSKHSILRDSIGEKKSEIFSEDDMESFKKGIHASANSSLLHNIFSVRTNQLFGLMDKHQNSNYLSGLLIGSELRSLLKKGEIHIVLCSSDHLLSFYKLGLQELGLIKQTTILSGEMIDKATIAGQLLILNKTVHQLK
jgi:2-dehydro-3-deoxygalactonokinase